MRYLVLAVLLIACSGESESKAPRVGDCLNLSGQNDLRFAKVTTCPGTHRIVTFLKLSGASWPGREVLDQESLRCPAATTDYLGPTPELWRAGDRTLLCLHRY
jgi:hypothetical protein